jgi:putative phosphoribosyl transferase
MFYDRKEAGQKLAKAIKSQISGTAKSVVLKSQNSVILALPRGGVIVAKEIADVLKIPLDVLVVRKIGYPGNPEYAIGAVGESGEIVLSEEGKVVDPNYLKNEVKKEKEEVKRRLKEYRGKKQKLDLKNKTVILVDDGLATGLSMKAAIKEVETQNPKKIIVAIPIAPPETIEELKKEVDEIIVLETPSPFFAIGNFYTKFDQVTDEEVKEALR